MCEREKNPYGWPTKLISMLGKLKSTVVTSLEKVRVCIAIYSA